MVGNYMMDRSSFMCRRVPLPFNRDIIVITNNYKIVFGKSR